MLHKKAEMCKLKYHLFKKSCLKKVNNLVHKNQTIPSRVGLCFPEDGHMKGQDDLAGAPQVCERA
jgi:hypothetical protein